MLGAEFSGGLLDQQDLAVDGIGHGVSPVGRHCERKRSNPEATKQGLDCFVASAPRNDAVVKRWHASEAGCACVKMCHTRARRKRGGSQCPTSLRNTF